MKKVTAVLTNTQINKAVEWYDQHILHVDNLVDNTELAYPPTDLEDQSNPALWKGSHWKWFIKNL